MPVSAAALLGRTVRWNGIRIGAAADVILDPEASRLVGFVVACEDGEQRFLPLAAAETRREHVELVEPLAISEPEAVSWYRRRGLELTKLLAEGRPGSRGHRSRLADVLVGAGGAVEALVPAKRPTRGRPDA